MFVVLFLPKRCSIVADGNRPVWPGCFVAGMPCMRGSLPLLFLLLGEGIDERAAVRCASLRPHIDDTKKAAHRAAWLRVE